MKKLLRNLSVLCFVLAAVLTTGCYEEEMPFLEVDHEVVLVGADTDKGTVVVTSNVQWTASSDVEWITIDNGFGNHKGTFEFFVAANTTPNERSGKITLKSNDDLISKTILVRQTSEGTQLVLGKDNVSFTKYAGEYLMSIACNGPWEVASSADWCKVDPASGDGNGAFKITVEENNTGADRAATITVLTEADGKTEVHQIEVFQSASNADLVVSPESQTLTAGAGQFTLNVATKGTWTASVDSDWLTLSEDEGSGDNLITVSATANDTGRERIAVITFTTGPENENRITRQVVVRQAAVDFYLDVPVTDYPLSVEEQTIEIPYVLEGSNVTVTASSSSKWMTVASVADGVATINVAENTTAIAREGVISFITHGQAGDPIIRQVRVAQAPTINILDVLADEYAVEWVGETFRIPIYSNTPVSARSSEPWCSVVADGQNLVITVEKNETAVPRVAVVTVTTDSEKGEIISKTTIIRQGAAYSELVVSPAEKNLYAIAQNFVASILTNNSWTASSDSDWLTIDKTEGTGDYMLNVNVAENKTGQVRVAVITIQTGAENSQRESATITVTQRPEQFYFEVPVRSFLFDKWGGLAKVSYITSGNEESVVASSSVDWLRVGTIEDGVVNVMVDENKTAEVRTGIVTVTCTPVFGDPIAIPVTFTQSPTVNILDVFVDVIDVSAKGDEVALPYYANTPVSVSSSEEWCHVSVGVDEDSYSAECCSYSDPQKIISIEVDPNRTGEARVAFVTIATVNEAGEKITKVITIRQAALYAALSVTPKNVVLPAHMGHFNLVINTTGTWAASTSCTWLDSEDDWAGFGDSEMFFEAGVNDTGAQREGQIIVATGPENNEREEQVVNVIQLARDTYIEIPISAYAVTKEQQTLEVGYYAAGDFKDMQVNCSESWIKYTGGDDETFEFAIEENTTAEPRTAVVTVTLDLVVGEPITDTFIVTQAPTINILDVYVDFYEASPWGEEVVLPFYGNTDVGVSVSAMQSGWCNVLYGTPNQDVDPQEIVIGISKNEDAEARTAYVTLTTVTDKGEKLTHIITIHQNPLNAALMVTPEEVVLPSMAENATFEMNIITSGTWTAATECTWLSPQSPANLTGTGDATIIWEAGDNDTGVQREATITVWTGPENETRIEKIVKVIQLAYDTYLDIPQDSYLIAKEGFPGLDGIYMKVACLMAGSIKDVVVDCGGADWIEWADDPTQPVFGYLNFWVAPNDTAEPRTTTVTVTIEKVAGEPYTDSFTVTQAGTYNFLEGLSDYVSVKPVEDTIKLPVLTNVDNLRAVASESWLKAKVTVDEDFDYAIVKIMAEANNTGKDREASITLITETDKGQILEKKIMVFQPAADTYFAILSGEELVVRKAGKNVTITAYASVNADKITMESNSPWVKLNNAGVVVSDDDEHIASGKFKVEENLTGEIRTAVVTVTFFTEAGEPVQKTVTITQLDKDGAEFVSLVDYLVVAAEGETVKLYFDTDDELTVNVSASWLNKTKFADPATSPQTLIVKAAENTTGKDRTAYITVSNGSESKLITVFQPAKDTHFAVLSADVIFLTPKKQDVDILTYANVNADQVSATSSAAWLKAKDPAVTVDESNVTLHFEATKNNTDEARTATVKISFVEENGAIVTKTVEVIQAAQSGIFNVPVDDIVLAAEGEFKDVAFLSSEPVTVTSSSEWLGHEEFDEPAYIRISAGANTTGLDREGFIQVTNGKQMVTINVFQPAATTEFAIITPDIYVISGEKQTFKVTAYGSTVDEVEDIAIRPGADWLTGQEKVLNGKRVSRPIEAAANTTGEERSALVKVTYIDDAGATHEGEVLVIQEPAVEEPSIFEIPIDYLVMAAAGESKNIAYLASDEISVISSSASWLTAKANEKRIRITAEPNTTGADREGYVQVSNGKEIAVITVFQPAAETEFALLSPDVIYIDAAEQDVNITAYGSSVDDKEDMSFRSDASWLTGKPKTINGKNVSRPFTAAENTSEEARTASILVTFVDEAGKTHTATVQIVQAGSKDDSVLEALVDAVIMDPAGETLKIGFIANDELSSALSSSAWLKASVNADKSFVKLVAEPNTTGKDRKAYVTVKNSKKTALITVEQPAMATEFTILTPSKAITSAAQTVALRAYCSEEFELADFKVSSDAAWLSLDTKEVGADERVVRFVMAAETNTTGAPRTADVTITLIDKTGKTHQGVATVAQSATDNILDVYVDTIIVPYLETKDRLPIYSNATSVVARSSNTGWLKVSVVTNADNSRDVNVVISKNETREPRTGVITVTAKFDDGTQAEKTITVYQEDQEDDAVEDYIFLALSDVVLPMEGGTKEVEVFTSASDYTVASSESWLTATKGSVIVTAGANDTGADRDATVTVTATFGTGETKTAELTVTQKGATEHFLNGPKTVIVDNEHIGGLRVSLNTDAVQSELTCTVPAEADWLTVAPYADAELLFTPALNTAIESRSTFVDVTATYADGYTTTISIEVIQSPAPEYYLGSQEAIYVRQDGYCAGGTEVQIPVVTNLTGVTAEVDVDWMTVTKVSDELFRVKVKVNETGASRAAFVTFKATTPLGEEKTCKTDVKQAFGNEDPNYIEISSVTLGRTPGAHSTFKQPLHTNALSVDIDIPSDATWLTGFVDENNTISLGLTDVYETNSMSTEVTLTGHFADGTTKTCTFTVTRVGDPEHYVVAPKALTVTFTNPEVFAPLQTDSEDVELTTDADWLTIAVADDAGRYVFSVSTMPYYEGTTRRAAVVNITAKYNDGSPNLTTKLEVVQEPKPGNQNIAEVYVEHSGSKYEYLKVGPDSIENIPVIIETNATNVEFNGSHDIWSAATFDEANGQVLVSFDELEKPYNRGDYFTLVFTFQDGTKLTKQFPLIQTAPSNYFTLVKDEFTVGSTGISQFTVQFMKSASSKVYVDLSEFGTGDDQWISAVTPEAPDGGGYNGLTVTFNNWLAPTGTTLPRTGRIKFTTTIAGKTFVRYAKVTQRSN